MASTKDPLSSTDLLRNLFTSKTDTRIQRLSKILSTSSGVDTTLTLVGYSFFLASSQLDSLQTLELKTLSRLFYSNNASPTLLALGSKSILQLADLSASFKTLAGMCSDFRTFTRLWGMLGIYAMAKRNYLEPPKDTILKGVAWSQTLALGAYYVYENTYYLAGKGVLRGWKAEEIIRWAKMSLKYFMAYVLIEYVRLWRTRQLREEKRASGTLSEKEVEKEEKAWRRSALANLAYTPLSLHWASESGPLMSDGWVGALMSAIGLIKFKAAWELTA
jgi:hypothetical protein